MNMSSSMMSLSGVSSMNISPKASPFEIYLHILSQIQNISTLDGFKQYTILQPQEFMTISEILVTSFEKLSNLSEFFVKKTNDVSVSTALCERLQRMEKLHHELINLLRQFSHITKELSDKIFQLTEMRPDIDKTEVTGYAYFDIIHRYRIQISYIEDVIKRINAYANLLKDKL